MNLLAFDSSTETLSAAVARGGAVVAAEDVAGGAQASATLLPLLQSLLARAGLRLGELDAIVFGRGPGSFTGLRTACSVAQGLGFGANVPVLGIDTLHAVAEDARQRSGAERVVAVLDARMGEVYAARFAWGGATWSREGDIVLAAPAAVAVPDGHVLAGNAFRAYPDAWPGATRVDAMPSAGALLRIAPALVSSGAAGDADSAMPVYIRDKVAQTTDERALARATPAAP